MLGFKAEVSEPGSYLWLTIGPHPILVVRGRDGVIPGFHNICRHRGGADLCGAKRPLEAVVCP